MNIQDYWLQSILQKQQGQPTEPNPALAAAMGKPSLYTHGNPLGEGASIAKQTSGSPLLEKIVKGVGKGLSNMGISGLRSSPTESVRQFGGMLKTPEDREQEEAIKQAVLFKQKNDLLHMMASQQAHEDSMRHKREVLNEQRRYHNMLSQSSVSKEKKEEVEGVSIPGIDLSQYPEIRGTKERNDYAATLKGSNLAFNALGNIKKDFDYLKEITKGNVFEPMGSTVPFINTAKEIISRGGGESNRDLREEVMVRKRLESQFARLEPVLEKGLKGSAAGEQTLKRFHELRVYFDSGQPMNIIEDRLNELLNEIGETREVAKLSLITGRHIDAIPKDYRETPEEIEAQRSSSESVPHTEIISKIKAIRPGLSDAAILEAQRRLSGG